jgi:hypothetical protein
VGGGFEFGTQEIKYSHHEVLGGTELHVEQELQKKTGEMNEPHLYTFKMKFSIRKKSICWGLTVMHIIKK